MSGDRILPGRLGQRQATPPVGEGNGGATAAFRDALVPSLAVAELLLDQLEADGHVERELRIEGESSFRVRWR